MILKERIPERPKEPAMDKKEHKEFCYKLAIAMRRIDANDPFCWWRNDEINSIISKAVNLGMVGRYSATQVYWTKKGIRQVMEHGI